MPRRASSHPSLTAAQTSGCERRVVPGTDAPLSGSTLCREVIGPWTVAPGVRLGIQTRGGRALCELQLRGSRTRVGGGACYPVAGEGDEQDGCPGALSPPPDRTARERK